MTESERVSSTKIVLPWRARVIEKAARDVGVTSERVAGPGEIVFISGTEPSTVDQHHVAVQIVSGTLELNHEFARRDGDLLDRINRDKITFNPLLIPFVWGNRVRRIIQEKPLQRRAARRLS